MKHPLTIKSIIKKSKLFIPISLILIFQQTNLVANDKRIQKYLPIFKDASIRYGVELPLLISIAMTESRCKPRAINRNIGKYAGTADRGIMQINSWWIKELKKYTNHSKKEIKNELYNPKYNIHIGAWVMKQCLNKFGDNWKAVDCYNKGATQAQNNSEYIQTVWKYYKKYSKIYKKEG